MASHNGWSVRDTRTSPGLGLSEREVRFFRDTGYLRFPTAFGSEELARLVPLVRAELAAGKPPVRLRLTVRSLGCRVSMNGAAHSGKC
jgi:hypothetical protein